MNEFEKNMEDIFDIEVESEEVAIEASQPSKPVPEKKEQSHQDKDYEYSRAHLIRKSAPDQRSKGLIGSSSSN